MSYPWTGFCRQYIEYQLSLFTSGAYLFPNSAGCGGECYHQSFRDRGSHPAALHIMPKAIGTYNICALYRVLFLTDWNVNITDLYATRISLLKTRRSVISEQKSLTSGNCHCMIGDPNSCPAFSVVLIIVYVQLKHIFSSFSMECGRIRTSFEFLLLSRSETKSATAIQTVIQFFSSSSLLAFEDCSSLTFCFHHFHKGE